MNGTSWADQWDNSAKGGRIGGSAVSGGGGGAPSTSKTAKYKENLGQGLDKTKSLASSGFKKLKRGSAIGFRWVKDKYHKTTNKH
ncbi:BnaA09g44360D [Brassica napus]|uniref:(rape) hypothetical protein n=1 Tax=Brassica napus TaxID=3708 RepID=A0A078G5E2_BRANA|nr:uncharacterized protein LOC106365345 [Brassica napus]CAF2050224.1 unnamed protein product [Brassica napus]CDY21685.1 BnaA09g44360D [Brassica napus]